MKSSVLYFLTWIDVRDFLTLLKSCTLSGWVFLLVFLFIVFLLVFLYSFSYGFPLWFFFMVFFSYFFFLDPLLVNFSIFFLDFLVIQYTLKTKCLDNHSYHLTLSNHHFHSTITSYLSLYLSITPHTKNPPLHHNKSLGFQLQISFHFKSYLMK